MQGSVRITPLDDWIRQKIGASRPTFTCQAVEDWQLSHLNETLALVQARSPFYRRLFAGMPETLHSLQDLWRYPFTTPEDVRRSPFQFVCVSQSEIQRVVTLQTSGTTGLPKRFFFTAEDQELTVDFFGVGMSTLTQPGDRVLILLPGELPGSVGDLLRLGLLRQGRNPIPYGPVRDPFHALDVIHEKKADCLVGSPTQVLGLARRWQSGRHKPRTVLLSTDYVPTAIVDALRKIWGCEVFNHYGATEMGLGGGVECEAHAGYHLREADLCFEIVDPRTGDPVKDGEYGEVVVSTLTRRGMPLIRYRLGDRSRYLTGVCSCGTILKRMEKIGGRYEGFVPVGDALLRLPDLDEALFPIPGLLNFTVNVRGDEKRPIIEVETKMLTDEDAAALVEQALCAIPGGKDMNFVVYCRYAPDEAGSLRKRVIVDQRVLEFPVE